MHEAHLFHKEADAIWPQRFTKYTRCDVLSSILTGSLWGCSFVIGLSKETENYTISWKNVKWTQYRSANRAKVMKQKRPGALSSED